MRGGFGKFGAKGVMAKGGFFKGIFGFVGGIFKFLFFGFFLVVFLIIAFIVLFSLKRKTQNSNYRFSDKVSKEDDIIDVEIVESIKK